MDWIAHLNQIKEHRRYTDTQLATALGISKSFLADLRVKRRPVPATVRFEIIDILGWDLTRDVLLLLLPEDLSERIKDSDLRRSKK